MRIANRRVGYDYQLYDRIEAGVALTGAEVKSLYLGQASLDGAYVRIVDGEALLLNAHIHPYRFARREEHDPKRTRRLLLHRDQILNLENQMKQKKLLLVPVAWYNKGRQIKLELALAKGKKKWEKKESLKRQDLARETEIELAL